MEKRNRGGGGRYREPPKRYDEFEYVAKTQTTESTQQDSSRVNSHSAYEENPTEELLKGQKGSKSRNNPSKYKSKGGQDGYDEYTTKSRKENASNSSNGYDNWKNPEKSTNSDNYDSYSYGKWSKTGGNYGQTTKHSREQDQQFDDYYNYVKNDQMDQARDDGKLIAYRKRGRPDGGLAGKNAEAGTAENQKSDKPSTFVWKECMICLLKCGTNTPIWTCSECRVTCHLKCIKDWIYKQNNLPVLKSSERDTIFTWSCPHCQSKNKSGMPQYFCFCGKLKNPKADVYLEPHSCGRTCGQKKGPQCSHPCTTACHSGKCPPCEVEIPNMPCFCGKQRKDRKCGEQNKRSCEEVCNKRLVCGAHVCQKVCHEGECTPCAVEVSDLKCFCGKTQKTAKCGDRFACEAACSKPLSCGNHQCTKNCHPGYSSANIDLVESAL
jgi:transcriptional repressor NF-X1